jgi:L-seryl-tRNA(Ser) seleniumtransferase
MTELRGIPSVAHLLQTEIAAPLVETYGRPLALSAIRNTLADLRKHHAHQDILPDDQEILSLAQKELVDLTKPALVPAINASGVVLHTNLGRAPLSQAALRALESIAGSYCTLEYDLDGGKRGSRTQHTESLLCRLTGAEAALVVNNNAAAVLLALTALARRKRVVISRTQLVEIGGGFRVPDVMKQSGAKLVEIGTTNRVHLTDYEEALQDDRNTTSAALILHAHPSNFRITGFTSEPELAELATIAHHLGSLLMDDLGSGALLDTASFGLGHEPMVQESLAAGADLVCFSGDKLLGGPQAGIILGRAELLSKLRHHPLARALRPDKLCLAALTATLLHYLKDEAVQQVPVWQMIAVRPEQLKERAERWKDHLLGLPYPCAILPGLSTVGGGSLPGETQPTFLLALSVPQPNQFLSYLRQATPPIIARLENDQVILDPRTVLPEQESVFMELLQQLLQAYKSRQTKNLRN